MRAPRPRTAWASTAMRRVFAPLLELFSRLDWSTFAVLWLALLVATSMWLAGRWWLLALAFPPLIFEFYMGNIHLLLAAAIVIGFRYPVTWSFVLLTKVTPGVGLLWFAVRREWRSLAIAVGRDRGGGGRGAAPGARHVERVVRLPGRHGGRDRHEPCADPTARAPPGRRAGGDLGRPDRPPLDGGRGRHHRPADPLDARLRAAARRHPAAGPGVGHAEPRGAAARAPARRSWLAAATPPPAGSPHDGRDHGPRPRPRPGGAVPRAPAAVAMGARGRGLRGLPALPAPGQPGPARPARLLLPGRCVPARPDLAGAGLVAGAAGHRAPGRPCLRALRALPGPPLRAAGGGLRGGRAGLHRVRHQRRPGRCLRGSGLAADRPLRQRSAGRPRLPGRVLRLQHGPLVDHRPGRRVAHRPAGGDGLAAAGACWRRPAGGDRWSWACWSARRS